MMENSKLYLLEICLDLYKTSLFSQANNYITSKPLPLNLLTMNDWKIRRSEKREMIKNGKVFSLELHMDQSFVYHLKLVISRLPSQIPWWEQPSVTFRYLLHTIAIASALFHWTYTQGVGTCQTNRLTTILLCVSQCYYIIDSLLLIPFFKPIN